METLVPPDGTGFLNLERRPGLFKALSVVRCLIRGEK